MTDENLSDPNASAADPAADPVLCSPFDMPGRHWPLDEHGIVVEGSTPEGGRRPSQWLNPLPVDKAGQQELGTYDLKLNLLVNKIRDKVDAWRAAGYPGTEPNTLRLLEHWAADEGREFRPFFAQREAIETLIWLREAATRQTPERRDLDAASRAVNDQVVRHCVKMATGTGKTVVMAMLIAWQTVNAVDTERRRNLMHGRRFLVLTPGLTIRSRLSVLKPSEPDNVYDQMGLLPADLRPLLNRARVEIRNFQSFQRQDMAVAGFSRSGGDPKSAKLLRRGAGSSTEPHDRAVRRHLGGLLSSGGAGRAGGDLVVINDEAHHCYLPQEGSGRRSGDKKTDDRAAQWFTVIRTLRDMGELGETGPGGQASVVYDFSATPFWIDTAARRIPEPFEWICSDFGLVDAIESGLVKVPRAPTADNSKSGRAVWRKLFENTKPAHKIPRPSQNPGAELPEPLKSALAAQIDSYNTTAEAWKTAGRSVPPVLIVVADTTRNADAIFEHIAGWAHPGKGGETVFQPGVWPDLSNSAGGMLHDTPRTLVVHSKVGEAEDAETTATGKEYLKALNERLGGGAKTAGELLDDLRRVLNTVGKPGQPGEQIRCVISVGMLSEGWDARNVTHIVGFRAFSTQLLCEQVTGRALRRTDYGNRREDGRFPPEHAEIVGIPFEFMPSKPIRPQPIKPPPVTTEVATVEGRGDMRVRWPVVDAYRWAHPAATLQLDPGLVQPWRQTDLHAHLPTVVEMRALPPAEAALLAARGERPETFGFKLAGRVVKQLKESGNRSAHPHGFFPAALKAVNDWLDHPDVQPPDLTRGVAPADMLDAAKAVLDACAANTNGTGTPARRAALDAAAPISDTSGRRFQTTLECADTRRSELSHAACHSKLEIAAARVIDRHPGVEAWARNFRLGWTIPYFFNGIWRAYEPDFVARLTNGVNLIVECKGVEDDKARAAQRFAEDYWIPCVAGTAELPAHLRDWRYVMVQEAGHLAGRIEDLTSTGPTAALTGS